MTLGEALRKKREELGITANKASMKLEVTRPAYEAWEDGRYQPKPEKWEKVAEYLGKTKIDVAMMLGVLDLKEIKDHLARRNGDTEAKPGLRKNALDLREKVPA